MSANQVVNQTSQELVQLASIARTTGDRMFHLQVERLKSEFEKSLQRYSSLQKVSISYNFDYFYIFNSYWCAISIGCCC